MSGFNFNNAQEPTAPQGSGINYINTAGPHDNVRVTEVLLEESKTKKSPYLKLVLENGSSERGYSTKMFLGTDVKPGNTMSGFDVTAKNLIGLIVATHNVNWDAAKALIGNVATKEEISRKIASLLVGKPFRAKFKGERAADGKVWWTLGQVESMRVVPTKMKFNPDRDIKDASSSYSSSNSEDIAVTPLNGDDMPF